MSRTVDDQARIEAISHYADRLAVLIVARDKCRRLGAHEGEGACQGAIDLLESAYNAEQNDMAYRLGFQGEP